MDVQVSLANEVETHAETFCARLNTRQRSLSGFLHDVAQLTGHGNCAASFTEGGFNLRHFAPNFCPRQASGQTNFAFRRHTLLSEFNGTEHFAHSFGSDYVLEIRGHAFRDELSGHLATA